MASTNSDQGPFSTATQAPPQPLYPSLVNKKAKFKPLLNLLLKNIDHFYRGNHLPLIPWAVKTYVGFYAKRSQPNYLLKDIGRARRLGIQNDFGLIRMKHTIGVSLNKEADVRYILPNGLELSRKSIHLEWLARIADPLLDSAEELKTLGIPHADQIASMSTSHRTIAFGKTLASMRIPTFINDPAGFIALMNGRGTYHFKDFDGDKYDDYYWYPKWDEGIVDRIWDTKNLDRLHDSYLQFNFKRFELQKDQVYVLIRSEPHFAMLLAIDKDFDKKKPSEIRPPELLEFRGPETKSSINGSTSFFFDLFEKYKKNLEVTFFYTLDGQISAFKPTVARPGIKSGGGQDIRIADPKIMVKEKWKEDGTTPLSVFYSGWDDWRWFLEMAKLYFPSRMYQMSQQENTGHYIDRNKLFLDSFVDSIKKMKDGPMKNRLMDQYNSLLKDKEVLIFHQGMKVWGNTKFVGVDRDYVYLRNTQNGILTALRRSYFLNQFGITALSWKIYESTRGMIPVMQVVMALSTLTVGVAVVGPALLSQGFMFYVKDEVVHQITKRVEKEAIKELIKRFKYQLGGVIISGVMALLPNFNNNYYQLIKGFIYGFSINTIDDLLQSYKTTAIKGPKFYRWYQLYTRLLTTVDNIENKLDQIKALVNDDYSEELAKRLEKIVMHSQRGVIMMFSNLQLMGYDDIKPLLKTLAKDSKNPTLRSRGKWSKNRRKAFEAMVDDYQKLLKEQAAPVQDNANEVIAAIETGLTTAKYSAHVSTLIFASGALIPVAIGAIVGGGGAADAILNDAKGLKIFWKIVKPRLSIDSLSKEEAHKMGEFFGQILGTFFLKAAIFDKKSKLGKLAGKDLKWSDFRGQFKKLPIKGLLEGELGPSLITPLIRLFLREYIILFQRYKKDKNDLLQQLDDGINNILLSSDESTRHFDVFKGKNERQITVQKIARVLLFVGQTVHGYLKEIAGRNTDAEMDLLKELEAIGERLGTHLNDKIPPIKKIIKEDLETWAKAPILFLMLSHFKQAINEFSLALAAILDPIQSDEKMMKIMDLLALIGVPVSGDEGDEYLAKRLSDSLK